MSNFPSPAILNDLGGSDPAGIRVAARILIDFTLSGINTRKKGRDREVAGFARSPAVSTS